MQLTLQALLLQPERLRADALQQQARPVQHLAVVRRSLAVARGLTGRRWGWRSCSLKREEYLGEGAALLGEPGLSWQLANVPLSSEPAPEASLRATVVIGVV